MMTKRHVVTVIRLLASAWLMYHVWNNSHISVAATLFCLLISNELTTRSVSALWDLQLKRSQNEVQKLKQELWNK